MKIKFVIALLVGCSLLLSMGFSNTTTTQTKKYTIEQFLNTKRYLGATFSFDEEKILFSSDESGIFNAYSQPIHEGSQKQITHSTNHAIHLITGFPADDRLLYASDDLGNELSHIYLQELDGSVHDLTPWLNAKSQFVGWCKDQKGFFFLSNKRDPKFMDLYEMDIEIFQPNLLYQNQEGMDFHALSSDKRYLALTKRTSATNSEFYLHDLSSNTNRNLALHDEDANYEPLNFSKDLRYIYYLTNEDSEFTYLKKIEIESGSTEIVERYQWDIIFCHFSSKGKYRVTGINEDGKTRIRIYDQETRERVSLPQLPEGEISQVCICKSEESMLLYVDGDCTPGDLYYCNLESLNSKKLTNSLSSEIDHSDLVNCEIIRYPSYDGTMIPALYYKPKDMKENMPALIWVHGGPGGQSHVGYNYLIQYLVNHGYPILCVNNRGSSGYGKSFYKSADHKHGEADLDDCIWAKHFLVGTGNIDKNKIGIIGGSYGGYMALAALAFRPSEMAVGVDICGVSNWVRTLSNIPSWWETKRDFLYNKIGNPETEEAYLASISPVFHADKIRKPLLVIQGANDPRVLRIESDQIIEEVNKTGVPNQYVIFEDEGHGIIKKENRKKVANIILEFLDKHL